MRLSECAGLLWSDLDLVVDREIKLTQQLAPPAKGVEPGHVPLKNKWARDVVLLDRALDALIAHLGREKTRGFGELDDFVFTQPNGRPLDPSTLADMVRAAATRANLGNVGPQVLRRTTATVFAYADIPIHVAAKMLGNSPEVFVKHYVQVHKDAEAKQAIREALLKIEGFGVEEVA